MERALTTAFISYSWDSDEHRAWVRRLAERIRSDGVDAKLDQWETAPGDQLTEFMERGVRDHDFVLIVCTPKYRLRSNSREGGVGYEGDVMTAEVFTGGNQRKFIPIWRKGQWEDAAPSWLAGKYHINLSGDPYDEEQYAHLIKTLRGERPQPPPVGSREDGGVGPSAAGGPGESSKHEPGVRPASAVTERFTKAMDQLGAVRPDSAGAPEIRAGGVLSLERIARESEEDFWPILDILSAYLRSVSCAPDSDHWDELAPEAQEILDRMDVAFTIEAITRLWPTERTANHRPLNLVGAFVPRLMLAGKHLQGAELTRAHLKEADLGDSNLENTSLDGANLESAFLQGANLRAANIEGAILGGANLSFANLQGAFLQDADLDGAMLWGATLENANVGSASLQNADLGSVDAYGANFRYANLHGANLRRARLVDANLRDADLQNANLWEADLSGASVEGADYGEQTRWPEGFHPPVTPERSD